MVAEQGGSLYELDGDLLAELRPDLILTQEQCDVCAVNEATVRRAAAGLPGSPRVESVNPTCLAGVYAMFRRVGDLLGAPAGGRTLIAGFEATAAEIARRTHGAGRRRRGAPARMVRPALLVGPLEPRDRRAWPAASRSLGRPGERSRRLNWDEVAAAEPEVDPPVALRLHARAVRGRAARASESRPEWARLRGGREAASWSLVDGSAYFSRPGPRLEASLRIAAAAIDPDALRRPRPASRSGLVPLGGEAMNVGACHELSEPMRSARSVLPAIFLLLGSAPLVAAEPPTVRIAAVEIAPSSTTAPARSSARGTRRGSR